MGDSDFLHEPDDREIEMMLRYAPEYSEDNARNIKNKFVQKAKKRRKRFSLKKPALIAAAAFMVFITTLVYAEVLDISNIYRIIFGDNAESIEPYIEPLAGTPKANDGDETIDSFESEADISIQSEYDGIVFKLISAVNDENTLRIFASVTDTKGDRLDESLDFKSWGLSMGYGGNISVVEYDKSARTAILVITSLGSDHRGNATLVVNDFLTGRAIMEDLPESNISVADILKEHEANIISQDEIWKNGGGGERKYYENSRLLKTDEMDIKFENTDMFSISNIGFADGELHIQAKILLDGDLLETGYYINAELVSPEKDIVYSPTARIYFITDRTYAYESQSKEPHDEYIEMIYPDITSPEQLNGLSLTIDYMKTPNITEGTWEFSFTVPEKVTTEFLVDREISINGEKLKIGTVSLSPLGITVHLHQNMSDNYKHNDSVFVEYKDGTVVELAQSSIHTYESESTLIFGGEIIEIENVKSLIINNEKVNIFE